VFSPDAKLLASLSYRETIVWNLATREIVLKCRNFDSSVAFSPDNSWLATESLRIGVVSIWSLKDGQLLQQLTVSRGRREVTSLAYSPDGRMLAVCFKKEIDVWISDFARILRTIKLSSYHVLVGFLPDSVSLVFYSVDSPYRVHIYNIRENVDRSFQRVFPETFTPWIHPYFDQAVLSPNGTYIAFSGATAEHRFVGVWDLAEGTLLRCKSWSQSQSYSSFQKIGFYKDTTLVIFRKDTVMYWYIPRGPDISRDQKVTFDWIPVINSVFLTAFTLAPGLRKIAVLSDNDHMDGIIVLDFPPDMGEEGLFDIDSFPQAIGCS